MKNKITPFQPGSTRQLAVQILDRIENEGAFAEPLLDTCLTACLQNDGKNRRLVTQMVFGTLRMRGYLDWMEGGAGAEERIVRATQAYAKRQATFFRNQWPELPCWDPDGEPLEAAFAHLGI